MWVAFVQFSDLSRSTPALITATRISDVRIRYGRQPLCSMKASGELAGEPLDCNETLLARQLDRPFIELYRIQRSIIEAGDFRRHQGRATTEVLRTVMRAFLYLPIVVEESRAQARFVLFRRRVV